MPVSEDVPLTAFALELKHALSAIGKLGLWPEVWPDPPLASRSFQVLLQVHGGAVTAEPCGCCRGDALERSPSWAASVTLQAAPLGARRAGASLHARHTAGTGCGAVWNRPWPGSRRLGSVSKFLKVKFLRTLRNSPTHTVFPVVHALYMVSDRGDGRQSAFCGGSR